MQCSESASGVFGLKIAFDKLVVWKMLIFLMSCLFNDVPLYRILLHSYQLPSYKQFCGLSVTFV